MEAQEPLMVLYDASCGLCRRLADYGRTRSEDRLHFVPWQDYVKEAEAIEQFSETELQAPPSSLRVLQEGAILEDAVAWEAILTAYPPFDSLSWIAERLGLMGAVSKVTYYGGTWLRGRCGTCP